MSLKSTRKILCFLFSVLIVAGNVLFFSSMLVYSTLCSPAYLKHTFLTQEVKQQCEKDFNTRMEALALESAIPARVFETVSKIDDETSESAVDRLFGAHDTSLYTADRVETFENLCKEYLEGNKINYNEQYVKNVAEKAAHIYADSYGIDDVMQMSVFIDQVKNTYSRCTSVGVLFIVVSSIAIFMLFSKKRDAFEVIFLAYAATGITFILTSVIALIAKFGQHALIEPSFYADAAANVVRTVFIIALMFGIALTVISYLPAIQIEKNRSDISDK